MSNEEIVTTATVVYDVRGVDQSIRSSQRLLYSVNAIRLAVEDFKRLGEDPSFQNIMWTGIQLTRVWTNLHRMVKATNQAQRFGLIRGAAMGGASSAGGFAVGAGAFGTGTAMRSLFGESLGFRGTVASSGLWAAVMGLPSPVLAIGAGVGVGVIIAAGFIGMDMRQKRMREEWLQRQREIAKSQGLEN